MKKILAILALCLSGSAFAADNTVVLTPGTGVTMRTKDIGSGVQSSVVILGDTSGSPISSLAVTGTFWQATQPVSGTFWQATQPVSHASGTVASGAFASGSIASGAISAGAMVDLLTMRQTVVPGTVASNSLLTGCIYNSSAPALSTGQGVAVQCDSAGNLKVVGIGVAAGSTTSGQTMSPVGCATTTSAPSNTTAQTNFVSCDTSGNIRTVTASGGSTGSAPPSTATYIGANASGATGGLMAGIIQCDNTAVYDGSSSGSTELVALTSGRKIYVCGYSILAGGTVNVKFVYGTGTNCATGAVNMSPAWQLTTQAGLVDGASFYRGMKTATANALCINTSGAVAAQAIVYYSIL